VDDREREMRLLSAVCFPSMHCTLYVYYTYVRHLMHWVVGIAHVRTIVQTTEALEGPRWLDY
jgi:hypothetical protein